MKSKILLLFAAMLILGACSTACKIKRENKKIAKAAKEEVKNSGIEDVEVVKEIGEETEETIETSNIAADTIENKLANHPSLVGDWVLITYVCCGRTSQTQKFKPDAAMKTLHLGADNSFYTTNKMNASSKKSGKYKVENKNEFGPAITLGTDYAALYNQYGNDTLVLNWGYMDLQTEVYLRKK